MSGRGWTKVDATIVECFRSWQEPLTSANPWFEIVADIETPAGEVRRVCDQQKLTGLTHQWHAPDPGDVVAANWDPARERLRLELDGDARYDHKVIRALWRVREARRSPGLIGRLG